MHFPVHRYACISGYLLFSVFLRLASVPRSIPRFIVMLFIHVSIGGLTFHSICMCMYVHPYMWIGLGLSLESPTDVVALVQRAMTMMKGYL